MDKVLSLKSIPFLVLVPFIKHLQDSNSFMICQARNEDIDMSYVAL